MLDVTRENLAQARRELMMGAKMLKAEIDAYGGTLPELYSSAAIMCEAILEYFAAEIELEAFEQKVRGG